MGILYFYFYDVNGSGTGDSTSSPSNTSSSSSDTQPDPHRIIVTDNQTPGTTNSTNQSMARDLYNNARDWSRLNQTNALDRLDNLRQDNYQAIPTLNKPSSPTNSDGSGDTIRPSPSIDSINKDFSWNMPDNNNNWD